ncbi:3445_t:CDS:2 [Diversispora eburnea]|uniref:3445_t:CDS:1 n=1 Tax=Diversispora eburnea TaxID=1213867 RepID=A0A9N8ZBA0_9GLOM|nr:3445_t:CDS:2 [Diversispora eburnea]
MSNEYPIQVLYIWIHCSGNWYCVRVGAGDTFFRINTKIVVRIIIVLHFPEIIKRFEMGYCMLAENLMPVMLAGGTPTIFIRNSIVL